MKWDDKVREVSPKRKSVHNHGALGQQSSFLLQPFLRPVDQHIEYSQENPVLRALFGGKSPPGLSPWTFLAKTSMSNCHPFKKTELSHDLGSDDSPGEIPKSLLKKPAKRRPARASGPAGPVREITIDPSEMLGARRTQSATSDDSKEKAPAVGKSVHKAPEVTSSMTKRKKVFSQLALCTVSKPRLPYVNSDRLVQLRILVDNAIKNHRVYSMTGCYNSVRNALKQRGWIEKIDTDIKGRRRVNKFEEIGLCPGEAEIMNRMLRNVKEDLCWLSRPFPYYSYKDFDKFEMINRLPRAYFSNKVGLCNSLQQIQWFYESGVCTTQFPRTYNTSMKDEVQAFKEDFRLTACIGLLKWFHQSYKSGGEAAVRSADGKVEMNVIEFALRRCAEFVKTKQHEDIDILETQTVWEYQWDNFIIQYYKIVNDGQVLKDAKEGLLIKAIASNVQSMLNILKAYWPQYDIEGYQNFWIIKPGGRCCGAGIMIKNNLDQILQVVSPSTVKETRYVVQKYIERPLLIYNTKFDIRQWFLVTNVYPLTVWMYKESYLRFCSQPFTLKNTHESIHLCNNAVQRKYKNGKRDRGLPDENMWDCYTFQTYLKAIGHPDAWDKYIYPGMKESFIGALLVSQETMERKKNCFELYGADFMISDCLTDGPWLIEINSNPAMDSSTSVTARMCPQVLEDIIKVVVDRRDNKNAPTGAFEMVYKQNCPPIPPYLGMSLCVKGRKAFRANGETRSLNRKSKNKNSTDILISTDTEDESSESAGRGRVEPESCQQSARSARSHGGPANVKRRKIDWLRKNIEDVRSFHSAKALAGPEEGKTESKDTLLRMLGAKEVKEFLREILKDGEGSGNETEDARKRLLRFVHLCQEKAEGPESGWLDFVEDIREARSRVCELNGAGTRPAGNISREWKTKVVETRKSCEDMLAKLHVFQEENSKTRFQKTLSESDVTGKKRGRRGGPETGEDLGSTLAISTENGAVRSIGSLADARRRSRGALATGNVAGETDGGRSTNAPALIN